MNEESPQLPFPEAEEEPKHNGFWAYIRATLIAGILVALPLAITFILLKTIVLGLDNLLISTIPYRYQPELLLKYDIHGLGLVGGFVILLIIGVFARNVMGRKLLDWGDSIIASIPGVRTVYGSIKQIVDTVGKANSTSFREVVMVEYPRKNLWAIAFVTGKTKGEVQNLMEKELINVFLPTTPNPTSGFLLFVPKKDIIKLHMTVDQGIKMVISAGIVTPTTAEGKAALKQQKKAVKEAEEQKVPE